MTFLDPKESLKDRKKRYILQTDAKTERIKDGYKDATRRFKFLLNLTDLFSHFINISIAKNPELAKIVRNIEADNEATRKRSKGHGRRRKTEKEEDAELIHDEEFEEETTVLEESPSYVNGKLRDYQVQGLNWLISLHQNSLSGILADEMGLGKTLQTISFLGYLRYYEKIDGPHIIIVPKSTLDNWRREFAKWTPDVNVLVLQGAKDERGELIRDVLLEAKFDVCITSFEMVIREKAKFSKIRWQYIIVDEAHRIKNEESSLSQIIRLFYSKNRLLITGTPLQNNLHELWALLNFLLPDVFGDSNTFDEWFENQDSDQDLVVSQLHKVLSPFLLRRIKADVEKSLLPKKEVNLYVGMTDMQVKWYKNLLEKDIDAVNGVVGKREGKTRLLNIVMQLRKCCNHPYLFEGAEPGPPYTTDEHLVFNAGKMIILDKLLKRMKAQGSRVLIFSQMSRLLDILEDYCFFREYQYCRIDGSTSHEDRIQAIDDYNDEGSEKFIFLLTTRAGGLGINLTSADIVVLYDSDWNPQADLQAMDRAHRIGQKKQVHVYRFVTENAIEEKVLERAAQKLRLDQLVIQQGRQQANKNATVGNSKDDLIDMIQHGAQKVFESDNATMVDDDIDEILKKGEEKTKNLNQKFSKLGLDDLQNFSSEQASAYEWNGENFAKRQHDKILNWINPRKRERKEAQYSVDDYYKDMWAAPKAAPHAKIPRAPKHYNIFDHQFYPLALPDLLEREQLAYKKKINYKVSKSEFGDSDDDLLEDDEERESRDSKRKKEQAKINAAEDLTEEEQTLKDEYLAQGFSDWNRRDFGQFIQLCAKHGRTNHAKIAAEMNSKSAADVAAYSKVFWERYTEIEGHERYVQQIEAGEEKIARVVRQQDFLDKKVAAYQDPIRELQLKYPPNNTKRIFTDLEDRFLLLQAQKHGLTTTNLFKIIKQEISEHEYFRFDWFFNSRSPLELHRRCQTLLLGITREFEGVNYKKRKLNRKPKSVEEEANGRLDTPSKEDEEEEADEEEDDEVVMA